MGIAQHLADRHLPSFSAVLLESGPARPVAQAPHPMRSRPLAA